MKTAYVWKHWSGWWVAVADDTGERIGGFHDNELDAYKAANSRGYLCR